MASRPLPFTCLTPPRPPPSHTVRRRRDIRSLQDVWRGGTQMTRDILLGVDAGTSVIKAVAFSLAGDQIAVAAMPNAYDTPGPGQVEQDMLRTWTDCAATLRELFDRVPNLAARAVAIAVTAQGDGSWMIDSAGEPVGGGLLSLDSRAAGPLAGYIQ